MKKTTVASLCFAMALASFSVAAETHSLRMGPSTTISFEPGTPALTDASKAKLKDMIAQARTDGTIDEVQVAVWSDNPAPRESEELSKRDRTLADRRAQAIKKYLKSATKVSDIDAYNMAERANWLARTFNTAEAELKSEIGRGDKGLMSRAEFKVFKDNGQPSKAVALVILK